jgi:hypothetical protein
MMTWTIDGCISMQNLDIVRGSNRIAMIDCENEALSDGDILANARLIAAAPDLLAASEAFISELDSGSDFTAWEKAKADLREAIAKATGA